MLKLSKRPFLGQILSRKHGQKCCPYNQNGKPLSQERVEKFLELNKDRAGKQFWQPNEDFTTLTRSFYLKNVYGMTAFIKDLYELDAVTTQQIPNVYILHGDIVRVELHTKPLKGLSYKDFELAGMVDSFNFDKYDFICLEKEKGYKTLVRQIKVDEDQKALLEEIAATAGGPARFANKFDVTKSMKKLGDNF